MARVPKTKRKELSPTHRAKIWTLYEEGYNPTQIHAKTGTPRLMINSIIARQILNLDPSLKASPEVANHGLLPSGAPEHLYDVLLPS